MLAFAGLVAVHIGHGLNKLAHCAPDLRSLRAAISCLLFGNQMGIVRLCFIYVQGFNDATG